MMRMPSRSLKWPFISALVTAAGLAAAACGGYVNNAQIEGGGFIALTVGVVPLIINGARRNQQAERERQRIEGEAFALAIELWRSGSLTEMARTGKDIA
jgi:hypothetical protein